MPYSINFLLRLSGKWTADMLVIQVIIMIKNHLQTHPDLRVSLLLFLYSGMQVAVLQLIRHWRKNDEIDSSSSFPNHLNRTNCEPT